MIRSQLEVVQFLADMVILLVSLYLSSVIRIQVKLGMEAAVEAWIVPPPLYAIVVLIWAAIFVGNGVYVHTFGSKFRRRLLRVINSHLIASFLYLGVLYLMFRDVSRLESAYFIMLSLTGMVLSRVLSRLVQIRYRESETRKVRVLIAGTGVNALHLRDKIRANPRNNLHLVGFVRLPFDDETLPELANQIVGSADDLATLVEREQIGELVIVPRWYSSEVSGAVSKIMYQLQRFPVGIHLAPDYSEISFFQSVAEDFDGLPLIGLRAPIFSPTQRLLKRTLDLAVAVPTVIVGSPIFALVALAVRLDSPGSIILRQRRVGIHGIPFTMYKFRSMYHQPDQSPLEETNLDVIKRPDDPRITRVGRWLRRTSLDELPQLINVIRGDMSLVGPRPELPERVQQYEWWQFKRFEVPQGMTGWWQVNGRADRPMHLHTEDDLYYIQNYSLWFDLQILIRTLLIVVTGEGAF